MDSFLGNIVLAVVGFVISGILGKIGEALTGKNARTRGSLGGGRIDIEHEPATSGSSWFVARMIGHLFNLTSTLIFFVAILFIAYAFFFRMGK